MRVKKLLALALAGALSASMLAGCAQTAVDHHFFTETEYITEIKTNMIVNTTADGIKKIGNLLKIYGIEKFYLESGLNRYANSPSADDEIQPSSDLCTSIVDDDIDAFLNDPCTNKIVLHIEYDGQHPSAYDYTVALFYGADQIYAAIKDIPSEDWKNATENRTAAYLGSRYVVDQKSEQGYVEIVFGIV